MISDLINEISLADAVEFIVDNRGRTAPTDECGIPLIATNCVSNEHLYPSKEKLRYVSQETYKNWFRSHPIPGDILLTNKGSQNGAVCLVPDPVDFCIAQDMVALRADTNKIYPLYLFAVLRSSLVQKRIKELNVDSVIPHFKKTDFNKLYFPLPGEETQKLIGDLYFILSYKIELNRQMNSTLEAIGQTLFKHWFVDFEFPDEEGKPYRSNGGEMVETELGIVPKGWRIGKLKELIDIIKKPLKPGEHLKDRKYVPIDSLAMRKMGVESFQEYTDAKSSLIAFERNDILLGAMRVYFHRVNLSPFAGITRTTTFVLRPKKKEHISFSLFLLNQDSTINYANSHSKGTTMPYAVWEGSLSEMEIIIPNNEILTKFNYLIYSSLEKIRDQIFEQITLSKIRDALLPKLMSGEIKVR